ncbi:MAG: hypothetical protein FWG10_02140 [Eubacteriaceae bacterium]|nr:hypothetical protein [Eubacteriaceae bacterium]
MGKAERLVEAAGVPTGSKHARSGAPFGISLMAGGLALANKGGAQILARMKPRLGSALAAALSLQQRGLGSPQRARRPTWRALPPRQIERIAGTSLGEEGSGKHKGGNPDIKEGPGRLAQSPVDRGGAHEKTGPGL